MAYHPLEQGASKRCGGTAEIIAYALQQKKPVLVINPEQPNIIKTGRPRHYYS